MYKVCLTNDDGPQSRGLLALAAELCRFCDLTVIVPDGQRSATGKGLTLNRPLRTNEIRLNRDYRMITHDGTPADSIVLARWFMDRIDLFVSGINAGANLGYQSILTSGTVGAALEAALNGYTAIAASMEAGPQEWFNQHGSDGDFERASQVVRDIALRVLKEGLPQGVDVINLNFPTHLPSDVKLKVTRPTQARLRNDINERIDPHGRKYYWFVGVEVEPLPGTDAFVVLRENNISVTPLSIDGVVEEYLSGVSSLIEGLAVQ